MTPSTLTTILNSAPMVIQGASKLINLIKEQSSNDSADKGEGNLTIESLNSDIERLESRLHAVDESNIEQIKLIEQLAKQNEALATSLSKTNSRLIVLSVVAGLSGLFALVSLFIVFTG